MLNRKMVVSFCCLWSLRAEHAVEYFGVPRDEVDWGLTYLHGRGYILPNENPRYPGLFSITPAGCAVVASMEAEMMAIGLLEEQRFDTGAPSYRPVAAAIREWLARN